MPPLDGCGRSEMPRVYVPHAGYACEKSYTTRIKLDTIQVIELTKLKY